MSELKRRHSALLESRRRRFDRAIELEDVATWALNLDKLGNARLRIRFDCRGKTKCFAPPEQIQQSQYRASAENRCGAAPFCRQESAQCCDGHIRLKEKPSRHPPSPSGSVQCFRDNAPSYVQCPPLPMQRIQAETLSDRISSA